MSFHYGQQVEVYTDGKWRSATLDAELDGSFRVLLDDGRIRRFLYMAPFYIRRLEAS